jgi:hypothetical protein
VPEPRVIDAYLDDLRTRLRGLKGADLIVAEVDDHLHEKSAALMRAGACLRGPAISLTDSS